MPDKVIEVSEEEYARNKRVFDTLTKMAKNPKAAKLLEQANKEIEPAAPTPLADADAKLNEPIAALSKKFDDFVAAQGKSQAEAAEAARKAELEAKWVSGRAKLKEDRWTDDGIKALEDLMAKHGILDHEIGRAYLEKVNPPPLPATPVSTGSWNFMEQASESPDKDIEKLISVIGAKGNPDGVVDKIAHNALTDFRQQAGLRR